MISHRIAFPEAGHQQPAPAPRMEIVITTMRTLPPVSHPEQAIAPTAPPIRVRLPAGGWQAGFRIQPDGRTVIEVSCCMRS